MFKEFLVKSKKALIVLASLLFVTFFTMGLAHGIQKDWGKVDVETQTMEIYNVVEDSNVSLCYKLYTPKSASSTSKAPAALLLHGYQNDHETCDAYAIELARRGFVVLAIDEYGHGKTEDGFLKRGYVNHKVTVNYGNDSETELTYKKAGGPERYRIMMNFSNLSFFTDHYSKDDDGNSVKDSSMGGIAAYQWLSSLDFVDNTKMIVSGHSMGTWASWTVAAFFSNEPIAPKAVVLQCGELFRMNAIPDQDGHVAPYDTTTIHFGNVLLLQAKYDEFSYFRDYKNVVNDDLLKTPIRYEFLGTTPENAKWNTVYGDFALGTAREIRLLYTNHRLVTHNKNGIATALEFISKSTGVAMDNYNKTTYQAKELLVAIGSLAAIASLIACFMVLKNIPFFAPVYEGITSEKDDKIKSNGKLWKGLIITMLISALTYPFCTQLGHGLFPLPEKIFRMSIGNGFFVWYLILVIIMLCFMIIPRLTNKKKGKENPDYYDYGLSRFEHKDKLDWALFGKGTLIAFIMVLWMYIQVVLVELFYQLDFRVIWPFFKGFTFTRFLQFLVYIPMFLLFFILNNSKIFPSFRVKASAEPGFKNFMSCWWRYMLGMAGGVFILILIEYIPFFLNIGPGADLLFSSTFGGPFMSLLIVFAPQVMIFSLICTYCYRKTGSVYVGAATVAMLACWVVTGGSAMI